MPITVIGCVFRMKVLPSFAYVPIYFVYFMFNGKHGGFGNVQNGHSYIFFLYLCTFILSTILMNISMSPKYKSAWIYYAAPVGQPGRVLSGMYKAIITLYFFPYFLVISCAVVAIWGVSAINDVIFRAAGNIFPLARQNVVIVPAVRSRTASETIGIALGDGLRHQRPDRARRIDI